MILQSEQAVLKSSALMERYSLKLGDMILEESFNESAIYNQISWAVGESQHDQSSTIMLLFKFSALYKVYKQALHHVH